MILTFSESLLHTSNCSISFTLIFKINSFNSQHPYEVSTIIIPPFTNEETEAQRLNNLLTVTKLESGRAGSLNPELMLLTTLLCCLSEEQAQRGKETEVEKIWHAGVKERWPVKVEHREQAE